MTTRPEGYPHNVCPCRQKKAAPMKPEDREAWEHTTRVYRVPEGTPEPCPKEEFHEVRLPTVDKAESVGACPPVDPVNPAG